MGKAGDTFRGARRFVRDYTTGLDRRGIRHLFDREAAEAYSVLTRDQAPGPEPPGRLRRLLSRAKILFLGLSYKLTPARRLLFAGSLLAGFLGLAEIRYDYRGPSGGVSIDFSAFWFVVSISGLVFLLALELVDRIRVRDEMEVARELQRELLPRTAPEIPGYAFAHSYRTANEVGGDYYDFQLLPDGRLALAVADASGHGMGAGLVMAIANATLKTAMELDPAPAASASLLNRTLCRTGGRRAFLTLFYGLLDPGSGRLEHVCAGHPFPLLRRRDGGVSELGRGGLPLGLRPSLELPAGEVTLRPGDLLLLYTDGLPEALSPATGEAFGFRRLAEALRSGGTAREVHDRIGREFREHAGEGPLTDDLTLVVVERLRA